MFRSFLIGFISIFSFQVFSSEVKSNISCRKSPKAIPEVYVGNHIENLNAHRMVNINSIGEIQELKNLPVWLSKEIDTLTPKIYSGTFWDIEPMGQYLYYLAGDFSKNEKGLLRYGTSSTSMFVEVNFEDDVLNVEKHDGAAEQRIAENQADVMSFVLSLTIGELGKRVPISTHEFQDKVSFISLKNLLSKDLNGFSRLVVYKPKDGRPPYVSLIYQEFRDGVAEGEYPRYTKVEIKSSLENLKIDILASKFIHLVNKYSNMPYVCLSGTTRA